MMKSIHTSILSMLLILITVPKAMAVEEARYTLVEKDESFEIRDYAPSIVAETIVEGDLEEAGSQAFSRLFRYISGNNTPRTKIAMTAPVTQQPEGQKIAMTAPVTQQPAGGKWAVSFLMPASHDMETLPLPLDSSVRLREIPARRMAVVRYSGTWSRKSYLEHRARLEAWMAGRQLEAIGEPVWARYDAPFKPWFLRRNEILYPIAQDVPE
ncbi:MAG: heme-binding protein [Gammaproteobacteria bacterium]|jgi:hypothetical protein